MTDTQWERYEVFLTDQEGRPAQHVGSVHGADPEIALLNARDVFVRRPDCVELWVVPSDCVLFRTRQELTENAGQLDDFREKPGSTYLVFEKATHRGYLKMARRVEASSPEAALAQIIREDPEEGTMWAVFPESAMLCTTRKDRDSLFEPALGKSYKSHLEYPTNAMMKAVRKRRGINR